MKTKVTPGKHPGTVSIWEVDEEGNNKREYPILSMGKKKLEAIVNNLDEIKDFIKGDKDGN